MGSEKPIFTKKRNNPFLGRLLFLLAIILIGVGIYKGYLFYYGGSPPPMTLNPVKVLAPGRDIFSDKSEKIIVCLGLDENRDERGIIHHKGSRTDTIIVLKIDKQAHKIGILSIPRDTWVFISDKYGYDKVNSAYTYAFLDHFQDTNDYEASKKAGIRQAVETIERFLDIEADHYVLLKIKAAESLVDSIGGITLDVEKDMDYDDNWGNLHIHLKKGLQKLNGNQAVGYARFRHDEEGDWGRIRRQQQVIKALIKELKNPENIKRIPAIAETVTENIDTDLSLSKIIDLAHVYKDFNKNHIVRGTIKGEDQVFDGTAVIKPYQDENEQIITRVLKDIGGVKPSQIKLRIINGCGLSGLARKAGEDLTEAGYQIIEIGDMEREEPLEQTGIVDHYLNSEGANRLIMDLGLSQGVSMEYPADDKEMDPDFTIILGEDYVNLIRYNTPSDIPELPELEPELKKEED